MKLSAKDEKLFIETYDDCIRTLIDDIANHKKAIVSVIKNHEFMNEFDFEDFAKEAFLAAVKSFHDHHYSIEAAIQTSKNILQP